MSGRMRINSFATVALAALFYWLFMLMKHEPALAAIIPFAEDPYDAVGSFCLILSTLLAGLALIRGFRPYRRARPSHLAYLFLARTQMAVPIGILITLAGDAIAMARHPSTWIGKPAAAELVGVMSGVAVLSFATLLLVRRSVPRRPAIQAGSRQAILWALAYILVLAAFPESLIQSAAFHLTAIVLAFLLIAASQSSLTVALLPGDHAGMQTPEAQGSQRSRRWISWVAVVLLGVAIGGFALAGEIFGEGNSGTPPAQLLLVSAMFFGAGTSFMLISFAFFRGPLGLGRQPAFSGIVAEPRPERA
jgi:hypothetical protein